MRRPAAVNVEHHLSKLVKDRLVTERDGKYSLCHPGDHQPTNLSERGGGQGGLELRATCFQAAVCVCVGGGGWGPLEGRRNTGQAADATGAG